MAAAELANAKLAYPYRICAKVIHWTDAQNLDGSLEPGACSFDRVEVRRLETTIKQISQGKLKMVVTIDLAFKTATSHRPHGICNSGQLQFAVTVMHFDLCLLSLNRLLVFHQFLKMEQRIMPSVKSSSNITEPSRW